MGALAIDGAAVALTFAAPEEKLVQLAGEGGAKLVEMGVAGVSLTAAGLANDKRGVGNGAAGYGVMIYNWASLKGFTGKALKLAGQVSGILGIINDGWHSIDDFDRCRAGKGD